MPPCRWAPMSQMRGSRRPRGWWCGLTPASSSDLGGDGEFLFGGEPHCVEDAIVEGEKKTTTPRMTAGMASRMKSHCQPAMP